MESYGCKRNEEHLENEAAIVECNFLFDCSIEFADLLCFLLRGLARGHLVQMKGVKGARENVSLEKYG